MNQRQTQYVSVFSTELFARYLHIRCLSVINCHDTTQAYLPEEIQQYKRCLCELSELTTTDVLAFKFTSFIKCQTVKRKLALPLYPSDLTSLVQVPPSELLVELLQKSAVEHLTTFRQLEAQHFGHLGAIVTTDFEALYACVQTWTLSTLFTVVYTKCTHTDWSSRFMLIIVILVS